MKILGRNIAHMGPAGTGQHTKMCNQILVAGNMIGHRVSARALQFASAVLFALFGVAMLAGWF